jgi:hypothetical protein
VTTIVGGAVFRKLALSPGVAVEGLRVKASPPSVPAPARARAKMTMSSTSGAGATAARGAGEAVSTKVAPAG